MMKLSRRRLRKLVRAEKQRMLNESTEKAESRFREALNQAIQKWMEYQLEFGQGDTEMIEDVSSWSKEVEASGNALYAAIEKKVQDIDGMLYRGDFA